MKKGKRTEALKIRLAKPGYYQTQEDIKLIQELLKPRKNESGSKQRKEKRSRVG